MADLVTIQLFNPALPLSTYNIRCISVRQASDREESADAEKKAITGCVIENTQRALTLRVQIPRKGAVCVCAFTSLCVHEGEGLNELSLNCERDKLALTSDEILSLFLLLKTSIRYRSWERKETLF